MAGTELAPPGSNSVPSTPPITPSDESSPYATPGLKKIFAQISAVFILVSCYFAMVLTNWGTVQSDYNLLSARDGTSAMWIQASAQVNWFNLGYY